MSKIITLNVPPRRMTLAQRLPALVPGFATARRVTEDVHWLKENAELLNILECTGLGRAEVDLTAHEAFYDRLEERITFFPQYYRFLLSIGLDLEDLGMAGSTMERLCHWVARGGMVEAELSDLQRAEAERLLARRGVRVRTPDPELEARLRAFIDRSATFALPNKKAAYELTHIVFYLSEYGRRDPELSDHALKSLEYAGILAFLDQNIDLLAEICIAMRQAGVTPSPIWEGAVRRSLQDYQVFTDEDETLADGYHEYLVSAWAVAMMGHPDTGAAIPVGRAIFAPGDVFESALRPMSAVLYELAEARLGDWHRMKGAVLEGLHPTGAQVLEAAEASTPIFETFFEGFARSPTAMV